VLGQGSNDNEKLLYILPSTVLLAGLLLALTSCGSPTVILTTSPTQAVSPTQITSPIPEDADSLYPVPVGVFDYKGNFNWGTVPPTVKLSTLVADNNTIYFFYRAEIDSAPGRTRYNIISIVDSTGKIRYNFPGSDALSFAGDITLTVRGLPKGITYEIEKPTIVFHISDSIRSGGYTFHINVKINGTVYLLPCTINVL
jgi:hypothetical protein